MPLEPPSIDGSHDTVAVATLETPVPEVLVRVTTRARSVTWKVLPLEHSPPDLNVLNATFLI